jgi:hypothetical protein
MPGINILHVLTKSRHSPLTQDAANNLDHMDSHRAMQYDINFMQYRIHPNN